MLPKRRTWVVPTVILINVVVYAMWAFADSEVAQLRMVQNFLVSWSALSEGRYWTLMTSVFSHSMLLHIMLNMFVLQSFGGLVEHILGSRQFLKFYLTAGIISSLAHCLVSAFVIGDPSIPALGASGAIAGIVLLFSLIFPKEKILIFGIIPVPAIVGAIAFIGLDLWGLYEQAGGGGLPIGHGAHLGGALTGILYYFLKIKPKLALRKIIQ